MGNLFSKPTPPGPPRVPTDKVVPLHSGDDNHVNRAIILLFMMRFDDVLDPEKLRIALEKLLSRDDWRKLGARMRLNDKGKLEYHIPERFDEKRPAFSYSRAQHDVKISEHPLASRLPRGAPGSKPAVVANPDEFKALMRRPDGPTRLSDYYLRPDEPQLSLHVESFADATLVSLSWPHTFLDAMGRRELLTAWTAVLEGRDGDVKPLHGVDEDPLATWGTGEIKEPYVLVDKRLSTWQAMYFGLRYIYNKLRYGEEDRVLCIPAAFMKKIRAEAMADLAAAAEAEGQGNGNGNGKADEQKKKPFVSEGDVISAWMTRLMVQHTLPPTSNKTIMIMNICGLRWALADDLLPPDKAYVGNAVNAVYALVKARDVLGKPLGFTAAEVRRSVVEQGTRAQLEARWALDLDSFKKTGRPALIGDGGMHMSVISNWTKGQFFKTDFSAAAVQGAGAGSGGSEGEASPNREVGRPSYIHTGSFITGFAGRGTVPVIGKDNEGNYWLQPKLQEGLWDKIQTALESAS